MSKEYNLTYTGDESAPTELHGKTCRIVRHKSGNSLFGTRFKILVEFKKGYRVMVTRKCLIKNYGVADQHQQKSLFTNNQ